MDDAASPALSPSPELTRRVRIVLTNLFEIALEKMGTDPAGLLLRTQKSKVKRMVSDLADDLACEMTGNVIAVTAFLTAPIGEPEAPRKLAVAGRRAK